MDIVFPCCAGLDVHKYTVVVCVRRLRTTWNRRGWIEVILYAGRYGFAHYGIKGVCRPGLSVNG